MQLRCINSMKKNPNQNQERLTGNSDDDGDHFESIQAEIYMEPAQVYEKNGLVLEKIVLDRAL